MPGEVDDNVSVLTVIVNGTEMFHQPFEKDVAARSPSYVNCMDK
jgi:hypothetical protein